METYQALSRAGDATIAVPTPLVAPEADDLRLEVAVEGARRSTAPETEAPEAPTGHPEAEPEGSP